MLGLSVVKWSYRWFRIKVTRGMKLLDTVVRKERV